MFSSIHLAGPGDVRAVPALLVSMLSPSALACAPASKPSHFISCSCPKEPHDLFSAPRVLSPASLCIRETTPDHTPCPPCC